MVQGWQIGSRFHNYLSMPLWLELGSVVLVYRVDTLLGLGGITKAYELVQGQHSVLFYETRPCQIAAFVLGI